MSKNIEISFELLNSALSLLEGIDVEDYDHDFAQIFGYVSHSLNNKKFAAMLEGDDDGHPSSCCSQCDDIPRSDGYVPSGRTRSRKKGGTFGV